MFPVYFVSALALFTMFSGSYTSPVYAQDQIGPAPAREYWLHTFEYPTPEGFDLFGTTVSLYDDRAFIGAL